MKKILYVDACIKRSSSRTERLARAYLARYQGERPSPVQTVILEDAMLHPLTEQELDQREKAIHAGDFSGRNFDLARSFAEADEVVIAAPYWDLSFPASLKLWVEQLCINGLTFRYSAKGIPCGLTKIRSVVYLTTSGGYIGQFNYGFEYIKGVFSALFGIEDIRFFSAEGLDIAGNDPEQILADAIQKMPRE